MNNGNGPTTDPVQQLDTLSVTGARVHNLKNIDVTIPHGRLTVITGLSGSGKSSLAFDTIFAEGQRRYIETFSSYARQMLGTLERPDVDNITGLSPVIAIEQKTINRNPRSTIGTTTEIYDFLRLLYARAGTARSYISGEPMVKYTEEKIVDMILDRYEGHRIYVLSPLVKNRKGHYKELFEQQRKKGYLTVRVDGELREITFGMKLDRYKNHSIELVVDKLKVSAKDSGRLRDTVSTALKQGGKQLMICDADAGDAHRPLQPAAHGSRKRHKLPRTGSPQLLVQLTLGRLPVLQGARHDQYRGPRQNIPDPSLSIHAGAIRRLGKYKDSMIFWQIAAICEKYGHTIKTPVSELSEEAVNDILNGTSERLNIKNETMSLNNYFLTYEGIVKYIEMQQADEATAAAQKWSGQFFSRVTCPECHGDRLNREALHFFVGDKNIADLCRMDIADLYQWSLTADSLLSPTQAIIAKEILKEIRTRLSFLVDVGLDYLSLNRASGTLSGGESQRTGLPRNSDRNWSTCSISSTNRA